MLKESVSLLCCCQEHSPSHHGTVQDRPQRAPDTERSTVDHRERNVIHCADATRQHDEETGDGIADPDANPCLPPGEAEFERGCLGNDVRFPQNRVSGLSHTAIIHVLMLKESAIQKATKLMCPHFRRSGSTGFKSWFVRKSCLLFKPGSDSHSYSY